MTAEVAVLNRSGVAIAADSAVTTGFPGQEKIFTSANKIFTLSKVAPVGIMINGHVEHFGCPWEIIIKEFRRRLGARTYGDLRQYVDEFQKTAADARFINDDGQSVTVIIATLSAHGELHRRMTAEGRKWSSANIRQALEEMLEFAQKRDVVASLADISERKFNGTYGKVVEEVIQDEEYVEIPIPHNCWSLVRRVVWASLSHEMPTQFNTGLIFTGYGDDDLYPKLYELNVDGGVFGKIRIYDVASHDIASIDDGAVITAFAQDDTVNAFLKGIDDRFSMFARGLFLKLASSLAEEILRVHTNYNKDERKVAEHLIHKQLFELYAEMNTEYNSFSKDQFSSKIEGVLRTAPKETLAELAEAMVSITSLKQRAGSGNLHRTISGVSA